MVSTQLEMKVNKASMALNESEQGLLDIVWHQSILMVILQGLLDNEGIGFESEMFWVFCIEHKLC